MSLTITRMDDLAPGTAVGEYEVTGLIGEGGMGVVYSGVHPLLGRPVAIKVLSREMAKNDEAAARFREEARAASSLRHANIVDVFAFGQLPDGRYYQVMDYLEGESLRRRLARGGRLAREEARAVMAGVLTGLAFAHKQGVVHRDVKPDNIFLCGPLDAPITPGDVRLLDFGLAKREVPSPTAFRTRTGIPMGTPAYMSPEQCRSVGKIDARTDLYSAGVVLYEMLSGRVPFIADAIIDVMNMHIGEAPPPLATLMGDPEPMEPVIMKAMAKDPAARWASAGQMLTALEGADETFVAREREAVPEAVVAVPRRRQSMESAAFATSPSESALMQAAPTRDRGWMVALGVAVVLAIPLAWVVLRPDLEGERRAAVVAPDTALAPAARAADAPATVHVRVTPEAQVYINGKYRAAGTSLHLFDLEPGWHTLKFLAEGHVPQERGVLVSAGEVTTLEEVILRPHSKAPRPRR